MQLQNANFEMWLKRDLWSLPEAIFLILGKEPLQNVPIRMLHHHDPTFARQYEEYIGIAQAAIQAGNLKPFSQNDGVIRTRSIRRYTPVDFIHWANSKGLHIPSTISNYFAIPAKAPKQKIIETRIKEIVKQATALDYDLLSIPWGGKVKIKNKCLDKPALFTEPTFDKAWQKAKHRKLIEVKDVGKYK